MFLRSWATVNITNLIENIKNIYSLTNKKMFAVVKADAYGHDSRIISRALSDIDFVEKLCVATPFEGKELREVGIDKDIVVLGGILKGEEDIFLKYNLTPVISSYEGLEIAKSSSIKRIHLKFDTGMNRLGFRKEDLKNIKRLISDFYVEGIMTHFPSADIDPNLTTRQIDEFRDILHQLRIDPRYIHIQNSAGIVYRCEYCTNVRVGLAMYGEKPYLNFPVKLKNVMSVYSKIISIKRVKKGEKISYCGSYVAQRDMNIGVVSFGYADGLPRALSNKGYLLINGKRANIVGNITMDMTMVDITDIDDVKVGDTVTIVGIDLGQSISFTDIANLSFTIPYEIMCGISKRVIRIEVK